MHAITTAGKRRSPRSQEIEPERENDFPAPARNRPGGEKPILLLFFIVDESAISIFPSGGQKTLSRSGQNGSK